MGSISAAVTAAAKQVYYVIKSTQYNPYWQGSYFVRKLDQAVRFESIQSLIKYVAQNSSPDLPYANQIARVEETPGVASRRLVTENELVRTTSTYTVSHRGTGAERPCCFLSKDGSEGGKLYTFAGDDLNTAVLFSTESDLLKALGSSDADEWNNLKIHRVIEVPATPTIIETVLA